MKAINEHFLANYLPCFKMGPRNEIIKWSVISRSFLLLLQFFANSSIPDHEANVFLYPKANNTITLFDNTIQSLLGGLVRWDGHFFVHIIKYGYTYEHTLAFFPLYPMMIQLFTYLFKPFFPLLNEDSIIVITFTVFNFVMFVKVALLLYDLTKQILNESLAYKAAVLFCFNPASVFFSALYSECLFSYLTFKALLCFCKPKLTYKDTILGVFYISLSMCTRSNGMLNVGFLSYYYVKYCYRKIFTLKTVLKLQLVKHCILLIYFVVLCFVPYILLQSYNYYLFCKDFETNLPTFIVEFGEKNDYLFPGRFSNYNQSWCWNKVPLSYTYIQNHYWNVGFLNYYKLKQLPNFILAAPVVYIIFKGSALFFKQHKRFCLNLGIFDVFKLKTCKSTDSLLFNPNMFVFVVHSFVLTVFCVLCIHVQVTTRIICSATPQLYWFCAYYFENVPNTPKLFLFQNQLNRTQMFIKLYFLGYFFVGVVLFCNFLPWT